MVINLVIHWFFNPKIQWITDNHKIVQSQNEKSITGFIPRWIDLFFFWKVTDIGCYPEDNLCLPSEKAAQDWAKAATSFGDNDADPSIIEIRQALDMTRGVPIFWDWCSLVFHDFPWFSYGFPWIVRDFPWFSLAMVNYQTVQASWLRWAEILCPGSSLHHWDPLVMTNRTLENHGKPWEIMGKPWKIMGNHHWNSGKSWKITIEIVDLSSKHRDFPVRYVEIY